MPDNDPEKGRFWPVFGPLASPKGYCATLLYDVGETGKSQGERPVTVPDPLPGHPANFRPCSFEGRVGRGFYAPCVRPGPPPDAHQFVLSEQVLLPEQDVHAVLVLRCVHFSKNETVEHAFHGLILSHLGRRKKDSGDLRGSSGSRRVSRRCEAGTCLPESRTSSCRIGSPWPPKYPRLP